MEGNPCALVVVVTVKGWLPVRVDLNGFSYFTYNYFKIAIENVFFIKYRVIVSAPGD